MPRNQEEEGRPRFSVVLPVFNEEGNLLELHTRLSRTLASLGTYEIIFVDDGSTDRSWALIKEMAARDPSVRGLRFSRNFGHHVALTAGLDVARGEYVITMDADLQDQPEEIPKLFERLKEGYDSVYGIRLSKKFSPLKRLTSYLFNLLMRTLAPTPYPINTNVFRIMNRPFLEAFKACRERERFLVGLFAWLGFRQTGVEVVHGERFSGRTKYDLRRMWRLARAGIFGFSGFPARIPGLLGWLLTFVGALWTVLEALGLSAPPLSGGVGLIVGVILLVGGIELLALGLLATYVERIHGQVQGRPLYIIAETTPKEGEEGNEDL